MMSYIILQQDGLLSIHHCWSKCWQLLLHQFQMMTIGLGHNYLTRLQKSLTNYSITALLNNQEVHLVRGNLAWRRLRRKQVCQPSTMFRLLCMNHFSSTIIRLARKSVCVCVLFFFFLR